MLKNAPHVLDDERFIIDHENVWRMLRRQHELPVGFCYEDSSRMAPIIGAF
jgi:hypothetical protein